MTFWWRILVGIIILYNTRYLYFRSVSVYFLVMCSTSTILVALTIWRLWLTFVYEKQGNHLVQIAIKIKWVIIGN